MASSQCFDCKVEGCLSEVNFVLGQAQAIPINFVNDSCLFLSATFVMVRCFLARVLVAQT